LSEVSADKGVDSIAEMAGGWGNKIMQDEPSFIVLEGLWVVPASPFPPGVDFAAKLTP